MYVFICGCKDLCSNRIFNISSYLCDFSSLLIRKDPMSANVCIVCVYTLISVWIYFNRKFLFFESG